MKQLIHFMVLLATLSLAAPTIDRRDGLARLREAPKGAETTGGYIVVLNDDADPERHASTLGVNQRQSEGNGVTHVFDGNLKGYAGKFDEATLKKIRKDPKVSYVEPDVIMRASVLQNEADYGLALSSQKAKIPFGKQSKYYYEAGAGSGVMVYIIDSGIYAAHSDFAGSRAKMIANFVPDSQNEDDNGHGTHVAGTIGGRTWGIAKNVTLAGIKVLNYDGWGTASTVITGVNYAVRHCTGKCVMNLSLGGSKVNALDQAVANAVASGITVVAAAGNNAGDACLTSPASAPGVVSVAAIDFGYGRCDFSNYGSCVTLFAPGYDIESAWIGAPDMSHAISGTSMAAPHVAGIAAYYLSFDRASTPASVKDLLIKNAKNGLVKDVKGSPNKLANNGYWLKK